MPSVFAIPVLDGPTKPIAPVDWSKVKAEIVAKLDLKREFEDLGVKFTGRSASDPDGIECHAVGREDVEPSAVVYRTSGVYQDSGSGEKPLHLFAFAVRQGKFGTWNEALKHYAQVSGVELPGYKLSSGQRVLERTFDYRDREGRVHYRVFRYITATGGTTFTLHPIDSRGNLVHTKGAMAGVEPLPYRLDTFPYPPSERKSDVGGSLTVWVTEGEKACEALVGLGLIATTSHGGTGGGAKIWPVIARHFQNLDVIVCPDNDYPGSKHAELVCGHLAGIARTVKRLDLPGLPTKGDAFEWVSQGGTATRVEALADACPEWGDEDGSGEGG